MLTIFNRREVLLTYSVKDQADAKEILDNNGIKYRVKSSTNKNGSARFGRGVDNAFEYRILVHKDDWPKAKYLLAHQIKRR
ncbi:MAG: hypothetical protein ACOX7J_01690 [Bacillota bacterium]|jgi:hypothetical protein